MLWSMLLLAAAGLASASLAAEETKISKAKLNRFDPVLSSNAYIGRIKENERLVQLEPRLFATDVDASNSPNGRICGYELSPHKHDDAVDQTGSALPFAVEWSNGEPVITLQPNVEQVDCEIKQIYRMFIRAFDCAEGNHRRYSERSSMVITVDDVNEYPPVFTHTNYLFKLYHDQVCASCRVEATDDDCANGNHRVCDYQIKTADVPFSIDSNGSISITKALSEGKYEFDVVAVDCHAKSAKASDKPLSEPARVTIQVVKSCKPTITDENPSKLTIHSDHTHIFDTAHVEACDETCAVESITSTVTLDANGIESGCAAEQCPVQNREYVLIPKDDDYSVPPQSRFMSFDGARQASIVQKTDFSGEFKDTFTIRMWMKHDDEDYDDKEHIFCKSDKTYKNRHITALLLHNGYLRLVMRKGPLPSNDQNVYASEWMWKLPQLSDDVWHSYRLFVNYPEKVDLYVDNRLISPTASDSEIVEDFALTSIDGTDGTVFTVGACWHGRVSRMVQHFHGQLSGLSIEQQEDQARPGSCYQECGQFLDIPDIQADSSLEYSSNSDRSVWTLRTDSSESFEQLLKHIVYRNTFDPIGPSGQRTVSIQTAIKCLGENFTYNLPTFSRRLAIDEKIRPTVIELKGDTNLLVPEATLNQGVYLFRNLSIFTDAIKKDQVDISDCSINTIPDLSSDERFIVPDEQLDMNNIRKDHTQTGLVLSGSGTIDTYQSILQQIAFLSKSPAKILDRSFLLVCIGAQEQVPTNEIRLRLHVEKQIAPPAPSAAVASNKLYVDNDAIRDNLFDLDSGARTADGLTGWPIAIGVCVSVSIAGVLILYLIVHIRSAGKQRQSSSRPDADMHPQMEWEDDIGLNIIVNPLEETKKSAPPMHMSNADELMPEYEGTSSEDDGDDDDDDEGSEHSPNDYSSDEDDTYASNQIHAKQHQHQLEWDDEAMEYGPKNV